MNIHWFFSLGKLFTDEIDVLQWWYNKAGLR